MPMNKLHLAIPGLDSDQGGATAGRLSVRAVQQKLLFEIHYYDASAQQ